LRKDESISLILFTAISNRREAAFIPAAINEKTGNGGKSIFIIKENISPKQYSALSPLMINAYIG
jgi:hypothetical protein